MQSIVDGQAAMCPGTGPGIVLRASDHVRANGVELDIPHGIEEVIAIERRRMEPALPKVAGPISLAVDPLRESPVNPFQYGTKTFGRRRDHHQMNMIGHQAVRQHFDAFPIRVFTEQIQVPKRVARVKEHLLPMVAALRDVVGHGREDNAGAARHAPKIAAGTVSG